MEEEGYGAESNIIVINHHSSSQSWVPETKNCVSSALSSLDLAGEIIPILQTGQLKEVFIRGRLTEPENSSKPIWT